MASGRNGRRSRRVARASRTSVGRRVARGWRASARRRGRWRGAGPEGGEGAAEEAEEIEGGGVGPVQVVQQEHERAVCGEGDEKARTSGRSAAWLVTAPRSRPLEGSGSGGAVVGR